MVIDMNRSDIQSSPFLQRIKKESAGYGLLSEDFIEREKRKELGAAVQIAKRLGRGITDEESQSFNI